MPKGIYIRTKEQLALLKSYSEIARKLPITDAQRETRRRNGRKVGKLPKTSSQREASRRNARKAGLNTHGDKTVKHHRNFCHGKLRPDDIIYMKAREHNSLHTKIQCQTQERDSKGRFKK